MNTAEVYDNSGPQPTHTWDEDQQLLQEAWELIEVVFTSAQPVQPVQWYLQAREFLEKVK